jgi:hypothetical protein
MPNFYKKKKIKFNTTGEEQNAVYTIYRTAPKVQGQSNIIPSKCSIHKDEYVQMASIDPAIKNYGIRIERRYINKPLIIPLLFTKLDLTPKSEDQNVYYNLTIYLDQYYHLFRECHIILFERQMVDNYNMIRMSQHTLSYFLNKFSVSRAKTQPTVDTKDVKLNIIDPSMPKTLIIEMESRVKGQQLGGAVGLKGRQLKQWAVDKAIELLTIRDDKISLEIIYRLKKKDDVSDTVVQLEALCSLLKLPVTRQFDPLLSLEPSVKLKISDSKEKKTGLKLNVSNSNLLTTSLSMVLAPTHNPICVTNPIGSANNISTLIPPAPAQQKIKLNIAK